MRSFFLTAALAFFSAGASCNEIFSGDSIHSAPLERRQTGSVMVGHNAQMEIAGSYSSTAPPVDEQDCSQPASTCPSLPSDMTRDPDSVSNTIWDHIIVGAGNAGLVVANRLSEDPKVKVLVIEGGDDTRSLTQVYKANETYAINNVENSPTVYRYFTTPQINNTIKLEWFGRGLGGSTTVNGQVWDGASAAQIDDIGKLGNDGWNWQTLLKYYKKAQNYHQPTEEVEKRFGIVVDQNAHSSSGHVTISHPNITFSGPPQIAFVKAVKSVLGINLGDLQSGSNNAVGYVPQTLYPDTDLRRVSSATSYYEPISGKRPNLKILLRSRAIKFVFDNNANVSSSPGVSNTNGNSDTSRNPSSSGSSKNNKRADASNKSIAGVIVQQKKGGKTVTLRAKHFVLSAGSIASPYLLEHSGIGDKQIVEKIGAQPMVELPGVGRMLAEQTQVGLNANVSNRSWRGLGASSSIAQPTMQQLFKHNVTEMEKYVRSNLEAWAEEQVKVGAAISKEHVLKQYELMTNGIFKNNVPVNENFFGNGFYGNESGLSMSVYTLTPYSRGYTHANTSDPWDVPEVNPRYYLTPFDMDIEVASLRAGKALFNSTELRSVSIPNNVTGITSTPDCSADGCKPGSVEEYSFLRDHVISSFGILDHAVGSCAMVPRNLGGVVNARFQVYGLDNLRVVDASVLPMQISAHPQATVYAIAEYASDLIKADNGNSTK